MDYSQYIIKELREGGIEIEYDGFLKNVHPTLTFFVICSIQTNTSVDTKTIVEMPPMSEKMIMSHNCGPVLENESDFEIVGIYLESPL